MASLTVAALARQEGVSFVGMLGHFSLTDMMMISINKYKIGNGRQQ